MSTFIRDGVKTNGRVTLELELGPEVAEGERVRLEVRVVSSLDPARNQDPAGWLRGEEPVPVPRSADPEAAASAIDRAFGAWANVPEDEALARFLKQPLRDAGAED